MYIKNNSAPRTKTLRSPNLFYMQIYIFAVKKYNSKYWRNWYLSQEKLVPNS